MPRWYILRTLLHKEFLRHLANRAGIIFLLMLIAASMLVSFFHGGVTAASGLTSEVRRCYVDFWEDSPLVEHLRRNVPVELADRIVFRLASEMHTDENGVIIYPQNTG